MLIKLSEDNFNENIETGVVVIDFYSDHCIPCKAMEPTIIKVSEEFAGKASFASVDVEASRELAVKQRIASVPTLVIYKDGVAQTKLVGRQSLSSIRKAIENVISNGNG